ncbi:MAG: hypothetical protein ACRDNG_09270 [Gaiellaceae bacterium]
MFALLGLAVLAFGSPDARALACGLVGLLGMFVGVMKLEVLDYGIVLSALPAPAARVAVVLAVSAGAAAMVVAALSFESALGRRDGRQDSYGDRAAARP